jgi:hypothetical protein
VSDERQPLFALAAAGVAIACCAIPVLFSAGVATALAGIGLGNWLIIVLGAGLATIGAARIWRHRSRRCD